MSFPSLLSCIFKATGWRRFVAPPGETHPALLILLALLSTLSFIAFEWALGGEGRSFQLYGVNSALLSSAVNVAFIGMVAPAGRRSSAIAIGLGLSILSSLALTGLTVAESSFLSTWADANPLPSGVLSIAVFAAVIIWTIGAIATVLSSLAGERPIRPVRRALGAVLGGLVAVALLPNWPTFAGKDFSKATANAWELVAAATASNDPPEGYVQREELEAAIEMAQPSLLKDRLDGLAARQGSESNVFVVGVAGSSTEKVFETEIKASVDVLGQRFKTTERSMVLVNPRQAFPPLEPAASVSNLATALRAIGERMDKDRDVLILALTSHGSKAGFSLKLGSIVDRTLTPFTLQNMLEIAEIKNRIIIVSACYSGVFVPDLADANTVVITASSATTNSFGCSNDRDWTYFGDAFFNQALRTAPTLAAAFEQAQALVSEWERRDGLTPSHPQIHIGEAISRLMPLVGAPSLPPKEGPQAQFRD